MNPTTHAPHTAHPAPAQPVQTHASAPSTPFTFWEGLSPEERVERRWHALNFAIDATVEYLHDCSDSSPYVKQLRSFLGIAHIEYQESLAALEENGGAA